MGKFLQVAELDDLLEEQGDELYTYLEILTRNPEDAGDLVQSVFLKFIEKVKEGRIIKATARNYLKVMAKNAFLELNRKAGRTVPIPEGSDIPVDARLTQIEANSRRIHIVFMEALSQKHIPPDVAQVLKLRLLDEASMEDICGKMNKSRSTIHRMLKKGLEELAVFFRSEGMNTDWLEY